MAVALAIQLLLRALLTRLGLPFIGTVAVLAIATVILASWVVEPSSMRPFGGWLHEPEPPTHRRLSDSTALWPTRVAVEEDTGVVEKPADQSAPRGAEILSLHWTVTALALIEGSTEVLDLATSVSDNPRERLSEIREVVELGNRPGLSEAAFQPGTGPGQH